MKKDIKVLLLEDNAADADLIVRQLNKSGIRFQPRIVETRKAFEESLDTFCPDIVLSDYSLPAFDAVSAFHLVKGKGLRIPFIIVSGVVGEENAVMLIKDGVTDFASKNNLPALPQKVKRALKEAAERLEKKEILQKLKLQTAALLAANEELVFQNAEKEKRAVQLLNANKELLAFNFISSHDLQEPLRKIQTFASIIMQDEMESMTDSGKRSMERIQAAATRMRRLIEDLLAFSQVSSAERRYETTDLNAVLEEVKSELRDTILEKQAVIESSDLLPARVVAFQFRQLLSNLVSNSLKFSLPGIAPRIAIATRTISYSDAALQPLSLPQKCDYWNLSFRDNGIGFESQYNELVFTMFQRLHHALDYSGTGIGLAIVKKIVDNHEGIVTASGVLNGGASFEIYIPINKRNNAVTEPVSKKGNAQLT